MTTALVGLLSAIVGLLIGSGFSFWSTRRSELAAASVACSLLSEEVLWLTEAAAPTDRDRLLARWNENRGALICELGPKDFTRVADAVHNATRPGGELDSLRKTIAALADLFWREHQAFILVPLFNYIRRNPLSKRTHASLDSTLPE